MRQRELELRNQLRYDKGEQLSPSSSPSAQQQNSDDSGISTTSSSPINGTSANRVLELENTGRAHPHHFVDHKPEPEQVKAPVIKRPLSSNPTYVRSTSAAAFVFAPRNPKPNLPVEYYLKAQPVTTSNGTKKPQLSPSMLTRTVSTPQLFQSFQPKKATGVRGFMQRFIEARGKINPAAAAKVNVFVLLIC